METTYLAVHTMASKGSLRCFPVSCLFIISLEAGGSWGFKMTVCLRQGAVVAVTSIEAVWFVVSNAFKIRGSVFLTSRTGYIVKTRTAICAVGIQSFSHLDA